MSEYWVSHKKYFCKYCEIYIADDAPSRTQHENGLRHQGNKERYIKNLYKTGERKKREEEEERREMARIDKAAQAAFANDVQSGHAKGTTSSTPVYKAPAPKAPTGSGGGMADYTTAKDLGIAQEEEKLAAEALARQQSQGVVGQWELVEASTPAAPSTSALPQKRPHQEEDEEGADYRVRRRKLAEGLGEIYDPGKITLVPKRNEKWVDITTEIVETTQTQPSPITWSKKRWRMAGTEDTGGSDEEKQPATVPEEEVKVDEPAPPSMTDEQSNEAPPPPEPTDVVVEPAPVKGMFKKRKAPAQAVGAKKGMRKQL